MSNPETSGLRDSTMLATARGEQAATRSGRGAVGADGEYVIDLHDVRKTYRGKVQALRGVNMRVHRGEIFGLLGPNGAGKSTLVKILMTVISPTACAGTLLGEPVGRKQTLTRVGYLPEHHKFPDYLTGRQVLEHFAAMSKVGRADRRKRAEELLELVGMKDWQHKRVGGYSKGMRQRIGVAQALMNDPDVVLLDEPTDGVDPVGRRDIRTVLLELKRRGKSVLVNSHLLSELEMVCDRLAIMVQGRVTSQGTLADLTSYGRRYEIEVAVPGAEDGKNGDAAAKPWLPGLMTGLATIASEKALPNPQWNPVNPEQAVMHATMAGQIPMEIDGATIRVGTDDAATIQPILDVLRGRGVVVKSVRPVRPSLEDLFIRSVTDPTTGAVLAPGAARTEGKR